MTDLRLLRSALVGPACCYRCFVGDGCRMPGTAALQVGKLEGRSARSTYLYILSCRLGVQSVVSVVMSIAHSTRLEVQPLF
jgi:hypothetical protein